MKKSLLLILICTINSGMAKAGNIPSCYEEVDQVIWVVSNLDKTVDQYKQLGFSQFSDLGEVIIRTELEKTREKARMVVANLGGAVVNWIQPLGGSSLLVEFQKAHGDGALSLVHRFPQKAGMTDEVSRLQALGIEVLEKLTIETATGSMRFVLMDTGQEGKYILGFTHGDLGLSMRQNLTAANRHEMQLNQYAFAIRDPKPVSQFWASIGLPELQISHPELGETKYYGEIVDHQLIQGWQKHGTIAYEWCIPVKPPIVYEDHIRLHGEGIHHLAFAVRDMDEVLDDFTSRGFVNSMGGTWGEKGQPGSGRYEYIGLEEAGGLTMELLWNYKN